MLPIESQVRRLGFFGLWQLFYIILLNSASTFLLQGIIQTPQADYHKYLPQPLIELEFH